MQPQSLREHSRRQALRRHWQVLKGRVLPILVAWVLSTLAVVVVGGVL